jgi:sugar lactone lactonase YvrE
MPAGTLANAVVPLADGGMLVSSFHDPQDRDAWNRMDRGERTGGVWEWHADGGWRQLATGGIPGANGIELSADGRTLYVSAWASSQLWIIDRASGALRVVPLDFRPDNIHRAPDGTLLVGGQRAAVRDIAGCGAACPQPWLVARFDPATMTFATLASGTGSDAINYACGALEVDGELFTTLRGQPRIAWTTLGRHPR